MLLVDERGGLEADGRTRCSRRRARSAIYEGGLVPVDAGDVLYRVRAGRIVVATGALEQPLVFPGNDLVGVMLPDGGRGASSTTGRSGPASARSSSAPTTRGLGGDRRSSRAPASRSRASSTCASEPPATLAATGRRGRLARGHGRRRSRRLRPARRLGRPPAGVLAARAGRRAGRVRRRAAASSSRPSSRPGSRRSARAAGDRADGAVPAASYARRRRQVLRLHLRGRDRRRT